MINAFCVRSHRVNDIELDEGTTVGKLRQMLHNNGYDVLEARAEVRRAKEDDKLIGKTDGYTLKNGDCVVFDTYNFQIPNLTAKIGDIVEEAIEGSGCGQRGESRCEEKTGSQCSCCKCGEKKSRTVEADGISVTRTEDGSITVHIEC